MINPLSPDYRNTPASDARPRFHYRLAPASALPAVTIITPFFNAGRVFYETAESVFRQSLQQWEWVLVNDGSSDPEALRILAEFRCKDARIRVVDHARNRGLSAARNTGFKEARTPFVFQLDADDLIEPTTLEKMVWHLTTNPACAFVTGFTVGFGSLEYLWRNGFHNGSRFLDENLVTATCMIRRDVHQAVGGYDEEIRGGLEDWDFWLKAAAHGYWGSTIPEFLDWYRRRDTGREHWDNLVQKEKFNHFRDRLHRRYGGLWEKFPECQSARVPLATSIATALPFENRLLKEKRRLLLIVPHFELGGADKFNLNLLEQLQQRHDYEVTVVATKPSAHSWRHEFQRLTPDVFALDQIVHYTDAALFLRYLITSRQPDVVCLSNSQLGYQLLPYLRSHFPELPFVDYQHMEQEDWFSGGYPRYSVVYQSQLERTGVTSEHLKRWMVARGAQADRIDVCHINIDSDQWRRDRVDAAAVAGRWNLLPHQPVILYAGRICAQKQPKVFAQVIGDLARKHSAFTALVAGDGPDLAWLQESVERDQLRQVRFLGPVSNDAIKELLAVTDIFFLPSDWEGISLAIYEAMAMEVVPVAADVGGQAELVTPDCGVLVRRGPHEAADYTRALLRLLNFPEERRRLAQAARRRVVEHFPIEAMGRRMHETFERARASVRSAERVTAQARELGLLHATEVIEQHRLGEYADGLHRERQQLMPFVQHSIGWQSALRTGRALAELNQASAAICALREGLQAAVASHQPDLELSARVEIAKAMAPLDPRLAEQTLTEALPLAEKIRSPQARRAIEHALKKLAGMVASSPAPKETKPPPTVSIVIPCYRQAHFLPEAVESVVAQTFGDWELIIVNDGSPDNTSEVARALIAQHASKSLRLVEQTNAGLSAARNAGIRAARGRYILPLDADDKLKPTLLERLVPVLAERPRVGFVYPQIQHFGALDTIYRLPPFDRATLIAKDNIACVCALFRKSVWEEVGGYNESMREGYEDWDFWIGCVERGWEGYCVPEPLFLYRKHGASMLAEANQKRERLVARLVVNHPKLYDEPTRQWAQQTLARSPAPLPPPVPPAPAPASATLPATGCKPMRVTYLISSILGVTGGNQTLLRQAEDLRQRGHEVTIVTYSPKPAWFNFGVKVIQVAGDRPLASAVPPSDVVVATYFTNAHELTAIDAPVKVYYAQGDQFVFADPTLADSETNRRLHELSRASYLLKNIRLVPNSRNLAGAIERLCGRGPDAILPVCTDQTIFRPLERAWPGSRARLLIVGPDARGTPAEPLAFKGIPDTLEALQLLARRWPHFTAVRMSSTPPEIFAQFPCEFYQAPSDSMKSVLYGTADILIYASHYDSCPRPPQEAMAAGCAVVCTASGGALEYCRDGENSLLVPIRSPQAIADAVEKLIRDRPLRERLVQDGLRTAAEFPREREWNEWETMLLRFVAEAGAGQRGTALPAQSAAPTSVIASQPAKSPGIELPVCARLGFLGEARVCLDKKQLPEAWRITLAAIQVRPYHPEACLMLAEIALAAGDSATARQCATQARSLAPGWKPARKFLKGNLRGQARHDWLVLPPTLAGAQPSSPAAPSHGPAPRLSVVLIARNEEQFLGQCLESVRGLADQLVVVDTGSTDRTVKIAEEHGAEVYHFAWTDDFSAARNAALEHATGDWVLMLDADEELTPEGRAQIRQEMEVRSVLAYRIPIQDVGREEEGCSYVPRLFRNAPCLFYVGRIHEQVFSSLEVMREKWGLENRLGATRLLHHGYRPEVMRDRDKVARNLGLLERAVQEMPGEPNLLMNYGLELVRSGRLQVGLEKYFEAARAMAALPPAQVPAELRESLYTQLCTHLMAAKDFPALVELFRPGVSGVADLTASMHFALGLAQMQLRRPAEAAEQMRLCLTKRGRPALSPVNTEIHKGGPEHCLALCLAAQRQTQEADQTFQTAIQQYPASRPLWLDYARFQAEQGDPVAALRLAHQLAAEQPNDLALWQWGAQVALSRPDFLDFARHWTAEAVRLFPSDRTVALQHAEALLFNQDAAAALKLWRQHLAPAEPLELAAVILCELVTGSLSQTVPADLEARTSQEFIRWYRRLVNSGIEAVILQVNQRLDSLGGVLPSAAGLLRAVLTEADRVAA